MNAFNWKSQPSETVDSLKPSPKTRKPSLDPKPFHNYALARAQKEADAKVIRNKEQADRKRKLRADLKAMGEKTCQDREQEIRRCNSEIERHMSLSQTDSRPHWKEHHRKKAVELAQKVKDLVASRPAVYVEQLERARGIA